MFVSFLFLSMFQNFNKKEWDKKLSFEDGTGCMTLGLTPPPFTDGGNKDKHTSVAFIAEI